MTQAPSDRHVLVGSMLRSYREAAGYKLDDAARILECDRSKISRIETGQRGVRPKELREPLRPVKAAAAASAAGSPGCLRRPGQARAIAGGQGNTSRPSSRQAAGPTPPG
jgi:hypothetical protein